MRPATLADIESIYELSRTYELAHYGEEEYSLEDIRVMWIGPEVNLDHTRLVFEQTGRMVGFLFMNHHKYAKYYATIRLLPDYSDQRVGDHLVELAETWAREDMEQAEAGVRVTLNTSLPGRDIAGEQRYTRAGWQEIRRFWRMGIELDEAPPAPKWPEGIELRPYVPGRDERVAFEVIDTAFLDHWGHIPNRFEEWKHWTIERANFDPSLWFVAYEGERAAGGSFCLDLDKYGWVDDLAVLRPWRGKGLGMALLLHSFGEFYRRGRQKVGLGVDSQNLTGAVRIYQRAGMHIVRENISYEKELRAGLELSTRTLAD